MDQGIARGGQGLRRAAEDALREYESAVRALRALVVRSLVEQEGMTLTAVAKRIGISRQMAARLYERGRTL